MPDLCNAMVKQGSKILICDRPLRHPADVRHHDEVTDLEFDVPPFP